MKVTVFMTNLYAYDYTGNYRHIITGLVGVFESYGAAMDAWKMKLKELGVPEEKMDDYQPEDCLIPKAHLRTNIIELDENAKYIDEYSEKDGTYVMEMNLKEVDMNMMLESELK